MTRESEWINLHASAVAVGGQAALITGVAGSGKSTLVMEMIGLGAELIADDRAELKRREGEILVRPPAAIAGLIEARGIGLIRMPFLDTAPVRLIVDLDGAASERLPDLPSRDLLGTSCPVIFGRDRAGLAAILGLVLLHGLERDI